MRLGRYRGLTLTVPLLVLFLARGVGAAPIRISYSAISGAMSSLWVAQEAGYFKREGLDTELLYIGGGSLLIQSMLSGDVPFAYGPSVPVINASLRGADLVLIGNTGILWSSRSCRVRKSSSPQISKEKESE
jgi:ABC-type nitrate/sulfonate/bicarbonate transport system substrate-binding protein